MAYHPHLAGSAIKLCYKERYLSALKSLVENMQIVNLVIRSNLIFFSQC